MTNQNKHTPTPWLLNAPVICTTDGIKILDTFASINQRGLEDARLVIRAVNSHEVLLAFVKRVKAWREYCNESDQQSNHDDKMWEMANNAIAQAEGGIS